MPRGRSAGCLRLTRQMLQPRGLLTRHRLARQKHPARGVPPARRPRLEICSCCPPDCELLPMQLLSAVELCSCSSAETPPHATAGLDAASVHSSSLKPRKSRVFSTSWNTSSARPITLAAQQRITEETKGCSLLEHTRTTTACLGHSALLLFLLLKIAGLLASTVDSARSRFGYRSNSC